MFETMCGRACRHTGQSQPPGADAFAGSKADARAQSARRRRRRRRGFQRPPTRRADLRLPMLTYSDWIAGVMLSHLFDKLQVRKSSASALTKMRARLPVGSVDALGPSTSARTRRRPDRCRAAPCRPANFERIHAIPRVRLHSTGCARCAPSRVHGSRWSFCACRRGRRA